MNENEKTNINHFLTINNNYLIDRQYSPTKRDPVVYWPSEASAIVDNKTWGSCARQVYWKIKGIEYTNKTDVSMVRRQLMGKGFEIKEIELTQKNPAFGEIIPNFKISGEIASNIMIRGEIDNIVEYKNEYRIIEYKSGSGWYFRRDVFPDAYSAGWPREYYILQVMLYLELARRDPKLKNKLKIAEIQCIDRDKCFTCSHTIELSSDGTVIVNDYLFKPLRIQNIIDRFQYVNKHVINNVLPPADFKCYINIVELENMLSKNQISKAQHKSSIDKGYGTDIQCAYCGYLDRCQHINKPNETRRNNLTCQKKK